MKREAEMAVKRLIIGCGLGMVVLVAGTAGAAVFCKKRSGAVFVRDACQKKETQIDLASFGAVGPAGPPGPPGAPGSARAWVLIAPDGSVSDSSPDDVQWTVTRIGPGEYCLATAPNLFSYYDPVLATIHGPDATLGQVSVNTEFTGDCDPYGGVSVFTADSTGTPADQWVLVAVL
jgi:hypothetical protein